MAKATWIPVEMVAEATKDAKARAEAIAQSTGIEVGNLRAARTGVFQITSRNSTEILLPLKKILLL